MQAESCWAETRGQALLVCAVLALWASRVLRPDSGSTAVWACGEIRRWRAGRGFWEQGQGTEFHFLLPSSLLQMAATIDMSFQSDLLSIFEENLF